MAGDPLEEPLALAPRERLRRLVEQEHGRVERERTCQLDELALRDAELRDSRLGVDVRIHDPEALPCPRVATRRARPPPGRHGEGEVLRDRQVVEHGRVLVDDRQAERLREGRGGWLEGPAADLDRARVGHDRAGGDPHERGLPGAVLAQEGVHLARQDLEADACESGHAGIGLHDLGDAERGAGDVHRRCGR